jgi:phage terminase large subunit
MAKTIKFKLFPHQKALFTSHDEIIYLRCGRGAGKTFCAALLCALRLVEGKRIVCLSQTSRQSREVMWVEIINQLNNIVPGQYKANIAAQKITFGKTGVIYFASYESLETLRGFTQIALAVCDEVCLAPPDLFSVVSFCMRDLPNGEAGQIVMLSTPRSDNWVTGFCRKENVTIINAKTTDNKRVTPAQVELMRRTCLDENQWKREFYGEECEDGSEGTLFTNDVLRDCEQVKENTQKGYAIGIDCSGLGVDYNVIVVRSINKIKKVVKKRTATAAEVCGIVKGLIEEFGRGDLSHIAIDEAYGLDLSNRLKEAGYVVHIVPFGGKASESVYLNNRAEMYCVMKKSFEEFGMLGLNEDMKRELNATRYVLNNANKIQIIPKSEIKLIVGHSPDTADALALTYIQPIVPRALTEYRLRQDREDMADL